MADETPPLDEAWIEAIRQRWQATDADRVDAWLDVRILLTAYDRLRAREAALVEIVEGVVKREDATLSLLGLNRGVACGYCRQWLSNAHREHASDCIMPKARALLAEAEREP